MSEITGTLIVKNEVQTFGASGFRKREFVLKTDSQYPQELPIELVQDKCDLLDNYNIGDDIKVHYNLNGRSWTNPEGVVKYFGSTQAWRIEKVDSQQEQPQMSPPDLTANEPDDLPF